MKIGQKLFGHLGSYTIQEQLYRTIYSAISTTGKQQVIIKTERVTHQLKNEISILNRFRNTPHIRQLIDEVQNPPALVLNRLDSDILDASKESPVTGQDLKHVARIVLERLRDMHDAGLIHTDVKPRNILINRNSEDAQQGQADETKECQRFSEVQLTDFGDTFPEKAAFDFNVIQPFIGAALWRSPEAMLGLRWDSSTDIWSFGATLLSLLYGYGKHMFKPTTHTLDDPDFEFQILVKQLSYFGPWPERLLELVEDDKRQEMQTAWRVVTDNKMHKPFQELPDDEVNDDEKELFSLVMKLDPRDRPKASDLLKHTWFGDGRMAGLKGLHTG